MSMVDMNSTINETSCIVNNTSNNIQIKDQEQPAVVTGLPVILIRNDVNDSKSESSIVIQEPVVLPKPSLTSQSEDRCHKKLCTFLIGLCEKLAESGEDSERKESTVGRMSQEERHEIENMTFDGVLEQVRSLFFTLLNSNLELEMTLRQKEGAERSEYEGCLIKLEAEVRSHIRVEQQLKLFVETTEEKLDFAIRQKDQANETLQSLKKNEIAFKQQAEEIEQLRKELKETGVKSGQREDFIKSLMAQIASYEQATSTAEDTPTALGLFIPKGKYCHDSLQILPASRKKYSEEILKSSPLRVRKEKLSPDVTSTNEAIRQSLDEAASASEMQRKPSLIFQKVQLQQQHLIAPKEGGKWLMPKISIDSRASKFLAAAAASNGANNSSGGGKNASTISSSSAASAQSAILQSAVSASTAATAAVARVKGVIQINNNNNNNNIVCNNLSIANSNSVHESEGTGSLRYQKEKATATAAATASSNQQNLSSLSMRQLQPIANSSNSKSLVQNQLQQIHKEYSNIIRQRANNNNNINNNSNNNNSSSSNTNTMNSNTALSHSEKSNQEGGISMIRIMGSPLKQSSNQLLQSSSDLTSTMINSSEDLSALSPLLRSSFQKSASSNSQYLPSSQQQQQSTHSQVFAQSAAMNSSKGISQATLRYTKTSNREQSNGVNSSTDKLGAKSESTIGGRMTSSKSSLTHSQNSSMMIAAAGTSVGQQQQMQHQMSQSLKKYSQSFASNNFNHSIEQSKSVLLPSSSQMQQQQPLSPELPSVEFRAKNIRQYQVKSMTVAPHQPNSESMQQLQSQHQLHSSLLRATTSSNGSRASIDQTNIQQREQHQMMMMLKEQERLERFWREQSLSSSLQPGGMSAINPQGMRSQSMDNSISSHYVHKAVPALPPFTDSIQL